MASRALVIVSILCAAAPAAAQPAHIDLHATGCEAIDLERAVDLLRLELAADGVTELTLTAESAGAAIQLVCTSALEVRASAEHRDGARPFERVLALGEVPESSRPRALALGLAELVRTSRAERVAAPSPAAMDPAPRAEAPSAATDPPPSDSPAPSAPSEPPAAATELGRFAFGLQLAAEGALAEPALMPQLGFIFHFRISEAVSVRLVSSFAYAPMPGSYTLEGPMPPPPFPPAPPEQVQGPTEHRLMAEQRLALGYLVIDELEGRVFASARAVLQVVPAIPAVYVRVDTVAEPVRISDGTPEQWRDAYAVSGGTEWTLRPEQSRRLEITASLGVGALGIWRYAPDGTSRFDMSFVYVHGALALGWRFEG